MSTVSPKPKGGRLNPKAPTYKPTMDSKQKSTYKPTTILNPVTGSPMSDSNITYGPTSIDYARHYAPAVTPTTGSRRPSVGDTTPDRTPRGGSVPSVASPPSVLRNTSYSTIQLETTTPVISPSFSGESEIKGGIKTTKLLKNHLLLAKNNLRGGIPPKLLAPFSKKLSHKASLPQIHRPNSHSHSKN